MHCMHMDILIRRGFDFLCYFSFFKCINSEEGLNGVQVVVGSKSLTSTKSQAGLATYKSAELAET